MDGSSAQRHPDWEWAFIPNITNVLEAEEEIANPRSWNFLARNQPACVLLENDFRVLWFNDKIEEMYLRGALEEMYLPLICVSPRPFQNSMWCCDVLVDVGYMDWPMRGAAVLVREIPSPLVLTCCLYETAACFIMTFITLAGNEVGQDGFEKGDGDQAPDIIFVAEDFARRQNLLRSENQKLCLVCEGLPRLVPDGTVLESET